ADWQAYAQPNQLFFNIGAARFTELISKGESFCTRPEVSRGLAIGDVDNDGDLDMLVTTVSGPARLFLNVARKQGHWLQMRVIEPALGGRVAYGALIKVPAESRSWLRNLNPAYSYFSSNDPRVHFGLGNVTAYDEISVIWADGTEELF